MRCLVTGGAGFIGSNLVDELIKTNNEVTVVDDLSIGNRDYVNTQANFIKHDITKPLPYFLKKGLEEIDYVFHMAAFSRVEPSIHRPLFANNTNITGTLSLLHACSVAKIKKFIFTSSAAVYGDAPKFPTTESSQLSPISPYGLQKKVGEEYCKLFTDLYNLPTSVLRYANVYGPRQPLTGTYCNVMGIFTTQKKNQQPLTIVGDGTNTRDYIHVKDVVNANILTAESEKTGNAEIINIGSSLEYSVNDIAKMIGGPSTNIPERVEPKRTLLNSKKAAKLLGWKPSINLKDWVKEYKKEQLV